jgi:hypothetical protein
MTKQVFTIRFNLREVELALVGEIDATDAVARLAERLMGDFRLRMAGGEPCATCGQPFSAGEAPAEMIGVEGEGDEGGFAFPICADCAAKPAGIKQAEAKTWLERATGTKLDLAYSGDLKGQ